jgi:hypothetical protein
VPLNKTGVLRESFRIPPIGCQIGAMGRSRPRGCAIWQRAAIALFTLCGLFGSACAFVLNFDELQAGGPDASTTGGSSGAAATGGTGGTSGGQAGAGGVGGASGTSGASGGSAGSDGGPARLPLSDLARQLAHAACVNIDACFGPAAELIYHDEDCEAFYRAAIEAQIVAPLLRSIQQKGIGYSEAGGAQCVVKLLQAAAAMPPDCRGLNTFIEDCKDALSNLRPTGGECAHRYECAKNNYCDSPQCPGTCRPLGGAGAPCLDNGQCTAGFLCGAPTRDGGDLSDGGKVCVPEIPHGQACRGLDSPCEAGTLCLSGTCQTAHDVFTLNENQPCWGNNLLCNPGLHCEFQGIPFLSAAICKPSVMAGRPCQFALPDECQKGSYCNAGVFGGPATCVALPIDTQPCARDYVQSVGIKTNCAATFVCVNNLCRPRRNLTEPCEANVQCVSGLCAPRPDSGLGVCIPAACP